jgi:hypothetical protein
LRACLHIHLGIPVRVIENYLVGCLQVHTLSSRARGEKEEELVRVLLLKVVYLLLTFGSHRLPVDTAEGVVAKDAVVLGDIPRGKKSQYIYLHFYFCLSVFIYFQIFFGQGVVTTEEVV